MDATRSRANVRSLRNFQLMKMRQGSCTRSVCSKTPASKHWGCQGWFTTVGLSSIAQAGCSGAGGWWPLRAGAVPCTSEPWVREAGAGGQHLALFQLTPHRWPAQVLLTALGLALWKKKKIVSQLIPVSCFHVATIPTQTSSCAY